MFANYMSLRFVRLARPARIYERKPFPLRLPKRKGRRVWGPPHSDTEKWDRDWELTPTTLYVLNCVENNPGNWHPNLHYESHAELYHPKLVQNWGVQDNYGYIDPNTREFIEVPEMKPELVVPDLTDFKLKPYVSHRFVSAEEGEPPLTAKRLFNKLYKKEIEVAFDKGEYNQRSSIFTVHPESSPDVG